MSASRDTPEAAAERLQALRQELERLDGEMIGLLAQRMAHAREIGALKQVLGLPVLDPAREAMVVRRAGALARAAGVPDEDVRYLYWHVVGLSRRAQIDSQ